MKPKAVHSSILSTEQETMIVVLRKQTFLPLGDCLYAFKLPSRL
jgi:hypothetical protein